ncbi:MAG: hypothetical protein DMG41_02840 [Acidobacteria bacterium]|nr:MAG: hypothetical protein DMG41_02840 [Acidobacteriota bacterium]
MGQFRKFMTIQPIFDATAQSARLNSMCNDVLLEYYRTLGKNRLEGNDAFQDPFRLAGPGQGPAVGSLSERIRIKMRSDGTWAWTAITCEFPCIAPRISSRMSGPA